jgi:hypothetical protein
MDDQLLRGALRGKSIATASGAGGTIYGNVQPPEGEVWDVYVVSEIHDDAARALQWCVIDTIGALILPLASVAATTDRHSFFTDTGATGPIRINHACYVAAQVTAMAGAKTLTINILYERILGAPTWTGA